MGPPQGRREQRIQMYASIASHIAMLPGFWTGWRNGRYTECVIGFAGVLISFVYHCLDTIGGEFADMSALQWHRLDNVASQITFVGVAIVLMQNTDARTDEIIRWAFAFMIIVLQERAPWQVVWTILPIALAGAACCARWVGLRQTPILVPWALRASGVAGAVAVICFYRGLDDRNDYARLWHSGWHVSVGALALGLAEATARFDLARKGAGDVARQHLAGWVLSARARAGNKPQPLDPGPIGMKPGCCHRHCCCLDLNMGMGIGRGQNRSRSGWLGTQTGAQGEVMGGTTDVQAIPGATRCTGMGGIGHEIPSSPSASALMSSKYAPSTTAAAEHMGGSRHRASAQASGNTMGKSMLDDWLDAEAGQARAVSNVAGTSSDTCGHINRRGRGLELHDTASHGELHDTASHGYSIEGITSSINDTDGPVLARPAVVP